MLNFSPEQTLKLLARRRRTRKDVASKRWEWQSPQLPTAPDASAEGVQDAATSAVGSPSSFVPERNASPVGTDGSYLVLDDSVLRANQRATARHIDDLYYSPPILPGTALYEGTAAPAILATPRFGVSSLPKDATTSALHWTLPRPTEWVLGKISVSFYYSSPVGSTNNFRIFVQVITVSLGEIATAGTLNLSVNLDLPGPAVANTILTTTTTFTSTSVNRSDDIIGVRVGRASGNAADTNANAFHFYAGRVAMTLGVQEAT